MRPVPWLGYLTALYPNCLIFRFHHDIAANRIALHAISMGGTCTGEHGIGIGKKKLLKTQFGNEGINMMRTIKDALDPLNTMNPGTRKLLKFYNWNNTS